MYVCVFVQVLPIIDLVRGIPCAATKRRHLRKALLQYLDEFDTCKCAPCPNNARPVLSGTECKCVCQTGTFGTNCEKRAPDYTSGTARPYCLFLRIPLFSQSLWYGEKIPMSHHCDGEEASHRSQIDPTADCLLFYTNNKSLQPCQQPFEAVCRHSSALS